MTRLASWQDFGTHDESAYPELWRGCVGAWAPCLGPTGTRLHDLSRFRNWGTLTNMDAATDWVVSGGRYALDFDGSDDYIDTAAVEPASQYSVTGFAAVDSFSNSPLIYTFLDPRNSLWDTGFLETNSTGSSLFYGVRNISTGQTNFRNYTLSQSLVAGRFFHFATVKQPGSDTGDLYINGERQTNFTGALNSAIGIGRLRFAAYTPTGLHMDGKLDDLRLYNRALTESEIKLLATRRGIAYERRKRRSVFFDAGFFNPAWARNSNVILSPVGAA